MSSRKSSEQAPRVVVALGLVGLLAGCGPTPDAPSRLVAAAPPPLAAPLVLAGANLQPDARVARLEAQVARLEQEVNELRGARREPSAEAGVDASARRSQMRTPLDRQAKLQALALRAETSESAFRGEAVESDWSRQTAQAVRLAFVQSNAGQEPRNVECRSRTCRVELASAGDGAPDVLIPLLTRLAPVLPHASSSRIDGADGKPTMVVYLTR
jgi:hypothetical protein